MKVCVFGAGAVGGNIATRLLAAGADDISLIARGAQLEAIRSRGLTLRSGGRETTARATVATDDPSTLPPQDLVIVSLKAHAVPAAAAIIDRLLAPGGAAVFMLNGIPWWWRHGLPAAPGAPAAGPLPLLDPEGALWKVVTPERTIGCVVYCPCEVVEPGVIVHTGSNRFLLAQPDGQATERLEAAIAMFRRADIDARHSPDLRRDIFGKLVSNASGNTIAALTRLDLTWLYEDPALRQQMIDVMDEVLAVAAALGWDLRGEIDTAEIAARGRISHQRPSMLQDVTQGRAIEVEAILGQVHAFAHEAGVPVPLIDAILPLLRGLDQAIRRGV